MPTQDQDFNPIVRLSSIGRSGTSEETQTYKLQEDLHAFITAKADKVDLDLDSNTYQKTSPTITEEIHADFEKGYYFGCDIITADRMAGDRWQATSSGHYNAVGKLAQSMSRGQINRIMNVTKPFPGLSHTILVNDDPENMISSTKTLAVGTSVHAIWVESSWILSGFDCQSVANTGPIAEDDSFTMDNGTVLNVSVPGVLENDTHPDGDPLTAILVTDVQDGTLVLNGDGSFDYTPNSGFIDSADSFNYKVNDGTVDGDTAVVVITIGIVTNPPNAVDDTYTTLFGKVLEISAPGVLLNDTDIDGDPLTANIFSGVFNGILDFANDGSFIYTPITGFSGVDEFKYTANDGRTSSNIATVRITVLANQRPVAVDDTFNMIQDKVLAVTSAFGVLANDTDPEGVDPLTAILSSGTSDGTLVLNGDGSFDYTPNPGFDRIDIFKYDAFDGELNSKSPATVRIIVSKS